MELEHIKDFLRKHEPLWEAWQIQGEVNDRAAAPLFVLFNPEQPEVRSLLRVVGAAKEPPPSGEEGAEAEEAASRACEDSLRNEAAVVLEPTSLPPHPAVAAARDMDILAERVGKGAACYILVRMDYYPATLEEVLEESLLSEEEAAEFGLSLLSGIEHLVEYEIGGVCFRADGVFVSDDGPVLDPVWGVFPSEAQSWRQSFREHSRFMAPEPVADSGFEPTAGMKTGMYSLGALLYLIVEGKLPFSEEDSEEPPSGEERDSPVSFGRSVSRKFQEVVFRCLDPDPGRRFETVGQMRSGLEETLASIRRSVKEQKRTLRSALEEGDVRKAALARIKLGLLLGRRTGQDSEYTALSRDLDKVLEKEDAAETSGTAEPEPRRPRAKKAPAEVWTNSLGMTFVPILPGKFLMGSPDDEPGRFGNESLHPVELTGRFHLQKTLVTQGQWNAVMGANPSHFQGEEERPVEKVSWMDCQEFIRRLNERDTSGAYRLPTEAEWEYACRAGASTLFCYGDDEELLGEYAWYEANAEGSTHAVARRKPNAWGLFDMHGNVMEWVLDGRSEYPKGSVKDPVAPLKGPLRMARGGSWSNGRRFLRCAFRFPCLADFRNVDLGFRLAWIPG